MKTHLIAALLLVSVLAGISAAQVEIRTTRFQQLSDTWSLFREEPALSAAFPGGTCIHGGKLWTQSIYANVQGILAWDGAVTTPGSVICGGPFSAKLTSDGNRIWTTSNNTRITATQRAGAGSFIPGELVNQEVSTAQGWFVRMNGAQPVFARKSGTFAAEGVAGDRTITGAESGATCEPSAITTDTGIGFWQYSTDGGAATAFRPVLDNALPLIRSLVNCGTQAGLAGKQLLLVIPYASATIWYCTPTIGDATSFVFTPLVTPDAGAVDHFHGGVLINGRLFVFSGDDYTTGKASLLHISLADLVDCINSANGKSLAWLKTHWGLDVSGATRISYLTSGAGAPYCVGTDQHHRMIDLIPDAANKYAYWIADSDASTTGYRVDLTSLKSSAIAGSTVGMGFCGLRLANGTILFSCASESAAGAYLPNNDKYRRIYMLTADGSRFIEVYRTERGYLAAPTIDNGASYWLDMVEFPAGSGVVHLENVLNGVGVSPTYSLTGSVAPIRGPFAVETAGATTRPGLGTNLLTDGRFISGVASWSQVANCGIAQEAAVVDASGGNSFSMKLTPAAAGNSQVQYTFDATTAGKMKGNWVTISLRYLRANACDTDNFLVNLAYNGSVGVGPTAVSTKSDSWRTCEFHVFCPLATNPAACKLYIYPRLSGGGTQPTYISDVRVVLGAWSGRVPANWAREWFPQPLPERLFALRLRENDCPLAP